MLEAGEDPRFIARRIAILASEDIGNADPNALNIAASAWMITERVGMPECHLTLAQAVIYMATAPKSNASAMAIWSAEEDMQNSRTVAVPKHFARCTLFGAKSSAMAKITRIRTTRPMDMFPRNTSVSTVSTMCRPIAASKVKLPGG